MVLILVLVEDSLGVENLPLGTINFIIVLILVLVEDSLGEHQK